MALIRSVKATEVLNSNGKPTIEVYITTDAGIVGKASVPSGASCGENEAIDLRDGDKERYNGNGVLTAVAHVNGLISQLLIGEHVCDQLKLDHLMIAADGTPNKSHLGANAILAASIALARAAAHTVKLPLYQYIGGCYAHVLPCPMMNIINGGSHADNFLDFQEFMIRPIGAPTFREALRWGAEIFQSLKEILKRQGHVIAVGDEGGFAPRFETNEEALDIIILATEKAGYQVGSQITLALDCAASEFYDKTIHSYVEKKKKDRGKNSKERSTQEQIQYLEELCNAYPIDSIEDPLDEHDWQGWVEITKKLGDRTQIVGDDIFVTNPRFIKKGIEKKAGNAVLIKLNQIGTLSETMEAIRLAQTHGYTAIVSHRSGETEDTIIADLAVAANTGQIKTGSLCRTERIAKYNRLLNIEEGLGSAALYRDSNKVKLKQASFMQ